MRTRMIAGVLAGIFLGQANGVFGAEGYETPLPGLFLAGSGSHPGGGISGAPGMNAARRVLGGKA